MRQETDEELLTRLRRGDEASFLALYRRRQGALYRFALQMSGSAITAEDITQEVFLALLRDECGFKPERGTLSGYLFGIARKMSWDMECCSCWFTSRWCSSCAGCSPAIFRTCRL